MEHEHYMALALEYAREAAHDGETPVGCIVVDESGAVIGAGRNRREASRLATAHAELEAIEAACRARGDWRLSGCTLYVTLEPCPMCAGAIIISRLSRIVYGARESLTGSCGSVINLFMEAYGHSVQVIGGVMGDKCAEILTDFFKSLRDA